MNAIILAAGSGERLKFITKDFPKPMIEQENELIKTILSWKGSNDQVDDILVIGIRI